MSVQPRAQVSWHLCLLFVRSTANQVHGGHRAGHRYLLQPQSQDISWEDRLYLLRPPRPHLCPSEKPLLPKELPDCWWLDSSHMVWGQSGVVYHVDQVREGHRGAEGTQGSTSDTWYGSSCLLSQHSGDQGRRVPSLKQPELHWKILSRAKQNKNKKPMNEKKF